jgi:hypothetical protein
MSRREVPAATPRPERPPDDGTCEACGGRTVTTIDVQFGVMPGDSVSYRACSACAGRAQDNVLTFMRRVGARAAERLPS